MAHTLLKRIMPDFTQLRLQIDDGRKPREFPFARLVEYLADFSDLVGHPDAVHLVEIEEGSTMPRVDVRAELTPRVLERVRLAQNQIGPKEANKAYRAINERLEADKGVGAILDGSMAKVIEFPGKRREKLGTIGPFKEPAELDGEIERVGGKDDTVPVWVRSRDGELYHCEASRKTAKALAPHLYEPIRVIGMATRFRNDKGVWELKKFYIRGYELLSDEGLISVVDRLRQIDGGWETGGNLPDVLDDLRGGGSH